MKTLPLAASQRRPTLPAALVLGTLLCLAPVHAQNGGPNGAALTEQVSRDSAAPRTVAMVHQGVFNYVRIERAEEGAAPSQHPLDVDDQDLARMLGAIRIGTRPLFNADDLEAIVPHLVAALHRAGPDQDISFAVTGRHSAFGLLVARDVTTGRLFNTSQGLQLIVGLAHRRFEDQFKANGTLIPFEPGRRAAPLPETEPVALKLPATAGSLLRADWVQLRPGRMAQDPAAPPPAKHPVTAAPAPRAASSAPGADARYREASERLKTLERLRSSGLISQQEYEEKRRQILQDL
jgi:hypothetical protein